MDFLKVNKFNHIPIYYQIKEGIKERINSGDLKFEDKIPSEYEISNAVKVSRMTVRHAIKELIKEDLLFIKKGKGTFVGRPKLKRDLSILNSLTKEMQSSGYKAFNKLLGVDIIFPSEDLSIKLEIDRKERVFQIKRLRYLEDNPVFIETSFVPYNICPQLIQEDLETNSLYYLFENKYGIILDNAIMSIETVPADEYQSKIFKIEKDSPILLFEQTTYSKDNKIIQFMQLVSKGDKYKFFINRKKM